MTIQNTTLRKAGPSQGNGVTTVFPFTFKVFTATDILVTYLDALAVESVLVLSTNYTVSLNADQNTSPGGSVTLLIAPVTATYITLTSQVTNTQTLALTNSGGFYPESINNALDRTVIEIQQLAEKVSRTVSIPTSSTASVTLPIPAGGNVIGWNATATALTNLPAATGTSLVNLAASTGSTLVGTTNGGTGSVTRPVASKLNDTVSVKDFGAVGDGTTNDTVAIQAALAASSGKSLYFPAGNYVVSGITAATVFTVPANITLCGDGIGVTTISFSVADALVHVLFNLTNNNVSFCDLSFTIASTGNSTPLLFNVVANNIFVENCSVDGGLGLNLTSMPYIPVVFNFTATGSSRGLYVSDCEFTNTNYVVLKSNISTATNSQIKFTHCRTYNCYNGLVFNSPLGSMTDITISNCTLDTSTNYAIGTDAGLLSFASCKQIIVEGNTFQGLCISAIHIEENTQNLVISNNVMNLTGSANLQAGITLLDNNVGGTRYSPINITITGNVVNCVGTKGSLAGITFNYDASAADAADFYNVTGNVVVNWTYGITTETYWYNGPVITGNQIKSCTNGIQCVYATQQIFDNLIEDATTGIRCTAGGLLGVNTFRNVTSMFLAVNKGFSALGWKVIMNDQTHAGGSVSELKTQLVLQTASTAKFNGTFISGLTSTAVAADISSRQYTLNWDGTTFTATQIGSSNEGGTVTAVPQKNTSNIDLSVFKSGAASTSMHIESSFTGMWCINL